MPAPSDEAIDEVRTLLFKAVDERLKEPLLVLDVQHHITLRDLHGDDPIAGATFLDELKAYARAAQWKEADINRLNFTRYTQAARNVEKRQERDLRKVSSLNNVVSMEDKRAHQLKVQQLKAEQQEKREAKRKEREQANRGPVEHLDIEGLTPDELIATNSLRLIAIGTLLKHRQGRVWYDDFHKKGFTNWIGDEHDELVPAKMVDDAFLSTVTTWLQERDTRLGKASDRTIQSAFEYVMYKTRSNEPKEWLESLVWDGENRLEVLLTDIFHAPNTKFNREAGRCWLVGAVARIYEPGCKVDTMTVFCGGQGVMKSQALEILGGKFYRAASSSIDGKDFLHELHGAWFFEIAELHSLIASRQGSARIKAVLSTRIDHFRLPFGRFPADYPRTAIMCGTTNNHDWHSDETGGRRMWPVHVGEFVDLELLRRVRDQLFAEAVVRYKRGEKWWDVPGDEQEALIEYERGIDPWEAIVTSRLEDQSLYDGTTPDTARYVDAASESADWGNVVTTQRVGIQWLRMTPESIGKHSRRLAIVLRRCGWIHKRGRVKGASHARIYWVPRDAKARLAALKGTAVEAIADKDDDCPF